MPSFRSLTTFANALLSQAPLLSQLQSGPSCPVDSPLSCHDDSASASCCFVTPGGQLLLTQFWDTNPTVGPVDSWTLHGLWPDNCDGTYPQYCHYTPQYYNITSILSAHSDHSKELLEYMESYWLPAYGTLEHFWQHEYNKHATCINTLAPSCYKPDSSANPSDAQKSVSSSEYTSGTELVDFFTAAISLFKTLPTYKFLSDAGIVPSRTATYNSEDILKALKDATGFEPVIRCRGGRLDEVWYSFNVRGSLQGGDWEGSEIVGKIGRSGCPQRGIKYLPKR